MILLILKCTFSHPIFIYSIKKNVFFAYGKCPKSVNKIIMNPIFIIYIFGTLYKMLEMIFFVCSIQYNMSEASACACIRSGFRTFAWTSVGRWMTRMLKLGSEAGGSACPAVQPSPFTNEVRIQLEELQSAVFGKIGRLGSRPQGGSPGTPRQPCSGGRQHVLWAGPQVAQDRLPLELCSLVRVRLLPRPGVDTAVW
jgi:hypothetical protein